MGYFWYMVSIITTSSRKTSPDIIINPKLKIAGSELMTNFRLFWTLKQRPSRDIFEIWWVLVVTSSWKTSPAPITYHKVVFTRFKILTHLGHLYRVLDLCDDHHRLCPSLPKPPYTPSINAMYIYFQSHGTLFWATTLNNHLQKVTPLLSFYFNLSEPGMRLLSTRHTYVPVYHSSPPWVEAFRKPLRKTYAIR